MIEGSGTGSIPLFYLIYPDPDPGGPKTCGSGGSRSGFGSATLRASKPVLRIHDIFVRIRILLYLSLTKKNLKMFCLLLLKVHLHHFSKMLITFEGTFTSFFKDKKSQNCRNQCFSYYICLLIEGSGSGSISLTNGSGCGSGRPKNIWMLRIRIRNTAINSIKNQ